MLPDSILPIEDDIARQLTRLEKRVESLERLEGGGALTLIEDDELAAAAASVDFQNIPQTFKHLFVVVYARSDRAASNVDAVNIRFNNDVGANYDRFLWIISSAGLVTVNQFGFTFGALSDISGALAPANIFTVQSALIGHYTNTVNFKTVTNGGIHIRAVAAGSFFHYGTETLWNDASAINRITIFPNTGPNFVAGSIISLYGLM